MTRSYARTTGAGPTLNRARRWASAVLSCGASRATKSPSAGLPSPSSLRTHQETENGGRFKQSAPADSLPTRVLSDSNANNLAKRKSRRRSSWLMKGDEEEASDRGDGSVLLANASRGAGMTVAAPKQDRATPLRSVSRFANCETDRVVGRRTPSPDPPTGLLCRHCGSRRCASCRPDPRRPASTPGCRSRGLAATAVHAGAAPSPDEGRQA